MKRFLILPILMIALGLTITGCDDGHDPSQANGTSDTGGGVVEKSTEADVREAVPKALNIITSEGFYIRVNEAMSFRDLSNEDSKLSQIVVLALAAPSLIADFKANPPFQNPSPEQLKIYEEEAKPLRLKYKSDFIGDYISKDQIYFLEKGSCPAKDKTNADASVDVFDIGAKVCLSLENLKGIPRHDLLKHIVGLLTHEVVHILGFGERHAELAQFHTISAFYDAISSSGKQVPLLIYETTLMMTSTVVRIRMVLEGQLLNFAKESTPQARAQEARILMGKLLGFIETFDRFLDESSRPIKIFNSNETKDQEAQLLNANKEIEAFITASIALTDEEINGQDFLMKIKELHIKADKLENDYMSMMSFYDF